MSDGSINNQSSIIQQYDAFGESGLNGQNFDQTDSVMNPFDMYSNQFGFFQSLFGRQKLNALSEESEEEMVITLTNNHNENALFPTMNIEFSLHKYTSPTKFQSR